MEEWIINYESIYLQINVKCKIEKSFNEKNQIKLYPVKVLFEIVDYVQQFKSIHSPSFYSSHIYKTPPSYISLSWT